jgi:hypothetical protein
LTLEVTGSFLAAAFRASGFGAGLLALTAGFAFAATFFAARTGLRAVAFAGLVEDFAWTARFADDFAFERDVDRLNPFVRLLLMCGSQKAAHLREQPQERGGAYHRQASKSTSTTICGCFNL